MCIDVISDDAPKISKSKNQLPHDDPVVVVARPNQRTTLIPRADIDENDLLETSGDMSESGSGQSTAATESKSFQFSTSFDQRRYALISDQMASTEVERVQTVQTRRTKQEKELML